jgi:hypothetical protein
MSTSAIVLNERSCNRRVSIAPRILTPTTLSISAASVKIAKRRIRRRDEQKVPRVLKSCFSEVLSEAQILFGAGSAHHTFAGSSYFRFRSTAQPGLDSNHRKN